MLMSPTETAMELQLSSQPRQKGRALKCFWQLFGAAKIESAVERLRKANIELDNFWPNTLHVDFTSLAVHGV